MARARKAKPADKPKSNAGRKPGFSPYGQAPGSDGAPAISVRLEPELMAWVRAQGGVAFVRSLCEQARAHSHGDACAVWLLIYENPRGCEVDGVFLSRREAEVLRDEKIARGEGKPSLYLIHTSYLDLRTVQATAATGGDTELPSA